MYEGKHPAIVPEALFQAAQEKQGRNPRVKGSAQVVNPLAGLLYCQCGRAMVYRTYTKGGVERSAPGSCVRISLTAAPPPAATPRSSNR